VTAGSGPIRAGTVVQPLQSVQTYSYSPCLLVMENLLISHLTSYTPLVLLLSPE
jgi:hypothetical protein